MALCDMDPAKEKMAAELGTKYYRDHREMMDREKPDGVVVSVPNEMHEAVGLECAERGIHVFMEKPITTTLESADRLIAGARKHKVKLLCGHHRRFNPKINAVRDAIRSGELGSLVGVNVFWCMYKPSEYFVAGEWRRRKGGGPILINTIHEIDNLRYVCGEISRVYAEVSNKTRGFEVEDTVSVSVRFKDGALASILMSDAAPSLWGYESNLGREPVLPPHHGRHLPLPRHEGLAHLPGAGQGLLRGSGEGRLAAPHQHGPAARRRRGTPTSSRCGTSAGWCRGEEEPRTSGEDAPPDPRGHPGGRRVRADAPADRGLKAPGTAALFRYNRGMNGAPDRTDTGTARLRVYAWLRQQRPDLAARDVELGTIESVQGLLDAVHLDAPEGAIILVNDRRAEPSSPVRAGDTVNVFPMLEGG